MVIELEPTLEQRLRSLADQRSISVPELVREVLHSYLRTLGDDSGAWLRATEAQLASVWPTEDFSAWRPPE